MVGELAAIALADRRGVRRRPAQGRARPPRRRPAEPCPARPQARARRARDRRGPRRRRRARRRGARGARPRARRAPRPRPRDLPAGADERRPRRARCGEAVRARRSQPTLEAEEIGRYRPGRRGGRLLLLPRGAPERRQARGRRRAGAGRASPRRTARCASRSPTTAPASTRRRSTARPGFRTCATGSEPSAARFGSSRRPGERDTRRRLRFRWGRERGRLADSGCSSATGRRYCLVRLDRPSSILLLGVARSALRRASAPLRRADRRRRCLIVARDQRHRALVAAIAMCLGLAAPEPSVLAVEPERALGRACRGGRPRRL